MVMGGRRRFALKFASNNNSLFVDESNPRHRALLPPRLHHAAAKGTPPRQNRPRRNHTGLSLASSAASLLSYTIEEETAADLEEEQQGSNEQFDPYGSAMADPIPLHKSRSAPNLAGFDRRQSSGRGVVYDGNKLDGMNSSHVAAEVFRTPTSSRNGSKERNSDGDSRASSFESALSPRDNTTKPMATTTEGAGTPPTRRMPLFREERAMRERLHGIHAATSGNVSDTSSNDGTSNSVRSKNSRNARQARIRRL